MAASSPRQYIRHKVPDALVESRDAAFWDPRPRVWRQLDDGMPPEIIALREAIRAEARALLTVGAVPSSRRDLARRFGVTDWRARREKAETALHVNVREIAAYEARLQEVGRLKLASTSRARAVDDDDVALEDEAARYDRHRRPSNRKRGEDLVDVVRRRLAIGTWRPLSGFSADELVAHLRSIHAAFLGRQPTRSELEHRWDRMLVCVAHALTSSSDRAESLAHHLEQVQAMVTAIRESNLYSFRLIRGEERRNGQTFADRSRDAAFVLYEPLWDRRLRQALDHAAGVVEEPKPKRLARKAAKADAKPASRAEQADHLATVTELFAAIGGSTNADDRAILAVQARAFVDADRWHELVRELEPRGFSQAWLRTLLEEHGVDPPDGWL